MNEPYKWDLNPIATLRELMNGRMEDDPGYKLTICGIHRTLWTLLNVDLNGYIPEEKIEEVNELLETAYRMGKRMDYRLRQYYMKEHNMEKEPPMGGKESAVLHSEVDFPNPQLLASATKGKNKGPKGGPKVHVPIEKEGDKDAT